MQVLTTAPGRFAAGMLENAMIEFDVNESYPMVLSLWHEELRKDVIVRAWLPPSLHADCLLHCMRSCART